MPVLNFKVLTLHAFVCDGSSFYFVVRAAEARVESFRSGATLGLTPTLCPLCPSQMPPKGSKRGAPQDAKESDGGGDQANKKRRHVGAPSGTLRWTRLRAMRIVPERLCGWGPTVQDILNDTLTPIANAFWAPGAKSLQPFNPQIIEGHLLRPLSPLQLVHV